MKTIDWKDIDVRGDLAVRSGMNFSRLEGEWYRPDEVFIADKHGWPGDWEGRIVLALTLLAQSTHRTPAYLDELLARVPANLNNRGYFGPILPKGVNDEQQMSGNSWFLRGLVEYYQWKKDPAVLAMIDRVVDNLLIPSIGNYARYPLDPETRNNVPDWKLSKIQSKNEKHHGTSDCGCAFIPLDGVTAAYRLTRRPGLRTLIDEMFAKYRELDVEGLHVQTHATLSAVRGCVRMFETTGDRRYLEFAIRRYELYKKEAWTENYGNYNWFGSPRWTEPCCIVDSFLVAVQLWRHTGRTGYLGDAHRIWYNALGHALRPSGCVGTDTCVGPQDAILKPHCYEVYWCCTMRAGEGFSRAIEYLFFLDGDRAVVPFYNDCRATLRFASGPVEIAERTGYPYEGTTTLTVLKSGARKPVTFSFFIPCDRASGARVLINGKKARTSTKGDLVSVTAAFKSGDVVDLEFPVGLTVRGMVNHNSRNDFHAWEHGVLLLGYDTAAEVNLRRTARLSHTGHGVYKVKEFGITLRPLFDIKRLTLENDSRQVLFAPSGG